MSATLDDVMRALELLSLKVDGLVHASTLARAPAPAAAAGGLVFPNYGKAKGMPVAGAPRKDLEFYASGCRKTLDDPSKSRWHDKERALLAAIEAELARQDGRQGDDFGPPAAGNHADDEIPF